MPNVLCFLTSACLVFLLPISQISVSLLPAPPADLPEVLSTPHSCLRCYMNRECMTYAAAQLRVSPSTSAQGVDKSHAKLLQHFTGHLSEEHLAYFQEWDRLIDLEADASTSLITTAWLQSSQEQEKASGKCISSLVLDEMETMMANASDSVAANDHRSALIVLNRAPESAITTPLSRLNIERGSHVVVSSDATSLHLSSRRHEPMTQYDDNRPGGQHLRHRMSIARGFLDSIDEKQVTIRVSRDEMGQLSHMNQQYSGLHRSSPGGSSAPPSLRFRVDKDDVSTGTGTLRQNLIKFLTSDVKPPDEQNAADRASKQQNSSSPESSSSSRERLPWLRDAIILLSPPSFDENLRTSMFINSQGSRNSATDSDFKGLAADFSKLNNDQRNAVEKVGPSDCQRSRTPLISLVLTLSPRTFLDYVRTRLFVGAGPSRYRKDLDYCVRSQAVSCPWQACPYYKLHSRSSGQSNDETD